MRHAWRWFGPVDKVSVLDAAQAGAEAIVSSLHHVPTGTAWTADEIARRQDEVRAGGLEWELVESIPISEEIKTMTGDWKAHVEAWKESLRQLAGAGIHTVCYNFMPVLDWTRTDLRWSTPRKAKTMRFDFPDFVAFDLFLLERANAAADYPAELVEEAERRFRDMMDDKKAALSRNVGFGLPGSADGYTIDSLRAALSRYAAIDADRLRSHLFAFLNEVVPVAESLDMRLCAHGDDPPWPLLGLPRILSTEADYTAMLEAVDSPANGVTFCTGSLGARPDNDLPAMAKRLAPRIHFAHLRNVKRETGSYPCSFFEDNHLDGDTDMVAVVAAIVAEEKQRAKDGRADRQIFMRPDHGQEILDDLSRNAQPGYPAIGRLKGLAELRGIERTLTHAVHGMA
ncbi:MULTISPECIES: mannonate dehydratase [unclassified Aureimonas]|uniref:mannonate dehydratase n=1 Tax=unclassified Aureimonas TaxID=2615206 RepID=UPI000701AB9C|nr:MULTISPECIES: mannonate dehydratase [unclassified Aureimonas]KQT53941.1 mannonate dehydratase [Aureimonas sp. Leaf427]KQT71619.1 mannonate dehydratase [Aureimonas sp. Leaf460]